MAQAPADQPRSLQISVSSRRGGKTKWPQGVSDRSRRPGSGDCPALPGAAGPEVGLGLTEPSGPLHTRALRAPVATEACPLLAPLPFPALPSRPHPCSLLAEPDRSPGRAQIQGPYLPGGVQHAVSHRGAAIVGLSGFQRLRALCPAPWRGRGAQPAAWTGPMPGGSGQGSLT